MAEEIKIPVDIELNLKDISSKIKEVQASFEKIGKTDITKSMTKDLEKVAQVINKSFDFSKHGATIDKINEALNLQKIINQGNIGADAWAQLSKSNILKDLIPKEMPTKDIENFYRKISERLGKVFKEAGDELNPINGLSESFDKNFSINAFKPIGERMAQGIIAGFISSDMPKLMGQIMLSAINQSKEGAKKFDTRRFDNDAINNTLERATSQSNEQEVQNAERIARRLSNAADSQREIAEEANRASDAHARSANTSTQSANNAERENAAESDTTRQEERQANLRGGQSSIPGRGRQTGMGMGMGMGIGGTQFGTQLQSFARQWLGIGAAVRIVNQSLRSAQKVISDIDKSITAIATVSSLSSSELWSQMPQYTAQAREFGVAINDVYKTSLLYYQQGMSTNQVTEMTAETLKLAKIAGIDTAKASDYMTNAFRAFKMEMSDVGQIADSYAALAANAATSVAELSDAMTKAATGMNAVGVSFQNTSAFITMMIETTRESSSTIGSAMSAIAARYAKLSKDPNGVREDGDNMTTTLNDVDKALQSIGIDMQDANGQIRDMDEVVVELAGVWDTLDRNTQSYVATLMAGARQKSRFLALVSDADRLSELMEISANSEDTAQLQLLKNMDSIETKAQQLKTSIQSLYTNLGIEKVIKGALDGLTKFINSLSNLGKIGSLSSIVSVFTGFSNGALSVIRNVVNVYKQGFNEIENNGRKTAQSLKGYFSSLKGYFSSLKGSGFKQGLGSFLSMAGPIGQMLAMGMPDDGIGKGALTFLGSAGSVAGQALMGNWGGAIISGLTAIPGIIDSFSETIEEKLTKLNEKAEKSKNEYLVAKGESRTLEDTIKKLKKLEEARYESNDAMREYIDYSQQVASSYPELVSAYDEEGNAVVRSADAYNILAEAANKAAEARKKAADDNYKTEEEKRKDYNYLRYDFLDSSEVKINGYDYGDFGGVNFLTILGAILNGYSETLPYENVVDLLGNENSAVAGLNTYVEKVIEYFKAIGETGLSDSLDAEYQAALDSLDEDPSKYYEYIKSIINRFLEYDTVINAKIEGAAEEKIGAAIDEVGADWKKNNPTKLGEPLTQFSSSVQKAILNVVKKNVTDDGKSLDKYIEENNGETYKKDVKKISDRINNLDKIEQDNFISAIGKTRDFSSAENYESFIKDELGFSDEEIVKFLKANFEQTVQSETDSFNQSLADLGVENSNDLSDKVSAKFYTKVVKDLKTIDKNRAKGLNKYSYNYQNAYLDMIKQINGNEEALEIFFSSDTDLTTYSGLKDLGDKLSKVDGIGNVSSQIEEFKNAIQANSTSYFNAVTERFKEVSGIIDDITGDVKSDDAINAFKSLKTASGNNNLFFSEIFEVTKDGAFKVTSTGLEKFKNAYIDEIDNESKFYSDKLSTVFDELEKFNDLENFNDLDDFKNYNLSDITIEYIESVGSTLKNENELGKKVKEKLGEDKQNYDNAQDLLAKQREAWENKNRTELFKEIDFDKITSFDTSIDLKQQEKAIENYLTSFEDGIKFNVEEIIKSIQSGDLAGIDYRILQRMTNDQKQKILDAPLNNLKEALEVITSGAGKIIDKTTVRILREERILGQVADNIGGQWVTKNISSSEIAEYAQKLQDNIEDLLSQDKVSLEEANKQLEEILGASANRQSAIESFAKEASSGQVSLNNLATIANAYGVTVTSLIDQLDEGIESLGNGNYKVKDFGILKFINGEIDETAKWYVEAQQAYLESISSEIDKQIEYETKTGGKIVAQVKNLTSAGIGDKVNVSYLRTIDGMDAALAEHFGNAYKDGMLTISKAVSISEILELVEDIEKSGQDEIGNSLSELKDAINAAIKNWSSLIGKGISGTLTNVEADALKSNFGLSDAAFKQTNDGLKLNEQSVVKIYNKLKETDKVASELTLKEIVANVDKLGDGFKNASELMQKINDLTKKEKYSTGLINKDLKEQLSLYRDIQASMLDNPDAWKLSDEPLKNPIQSGLNVWKSGGDWMDAFNEAKTKNYMGVEDFTNIINFVAEQVGDSAAIFQGKFKDASSLIQAGYEAIKNIDGKQVIDLSQIGVDFLSGTENMGSDIETGIQNLASSQVKMLDGVIGMLEVVVAMEKLGDIDADGDGSLSFDEIFEKKFGQLGDKTASEYLLNLAETNEDLSNGLKSIMFGKNSLFELLEDKNLIQNEEEFTSVFSSLIKNLVNMDDWSTESFAEVFQKLQDSMVKGVNAVFQDGINFTDLLTGKQWTFDENEVTKEMTGQLTESIGKAVEVADVSEAVKKAATGQELTIDESLINLVYQGQISIDENGKFVVEGVGTFDSKDKAIAAAVAQNKREEGTLVGTGTGSNGDNKVVYKLPDSEAKIEQTINGENIEYKAVGKDGSEGTGSTEAEAIENMLRKSAGIGEGEELTAIQRSNAMYRTGVTATIEATAQVVGNNKESTPEARGAALETVRKTKEELAEELANSENNGVFTYNVGGIEYEIAGQDATTAAEALKTQLQQDFGIETQNVDAVINATVNANGNAGVLALLENTLEGQEYKANIVATIGQQGTEEQSQVAPIAQNIEVNTNGDGSAIYQAIESGITELTPMTQNVVVTTTNVEEQTGENKGKETTNKVSTEFNVDVSPIIEAGATISNAVDGAVSKLTNLSSAINKIPDGKDKLVSNVASAIKKLDSKTVTADVKVNVTVDKPAEATGNIKVSNGNSFNSTTGSSVSLNTRLAKAKGTAKAGGTLMGELGPELVVSNGHYYTVGNNGAEFVNLPSDAIVFNHLQTQKLLNNGSVDSTGKPKFSEKRSVAFASGNTKGEAMASASAALAALKELRAMWQSLASASAKDLGRKSGGGGGGGGGGKESANYLHDLDIWYNILRQIETIEAEIGFHEKARSTYIHAMNEDGAQYVKSLEQSSKLIQDQLDNYSQIRKLTLDYYNQRVSDLENSPYGQLVEVLSDGTVQYKHEGFQLLAELTKTKGADGVSAQYTSKQQLAMIKAAGFDMSLLEHKSDGTKAETDEDKLEAFWDEVDGWTDELTELYKSIQDYDQQIAELTSELEKLAEEVNKTVVAGKKLIYEAIVGEMQSAINELKSSLDAVKDASEDYVNGLSDALERERGMYESQQNAQDLTKLQRQLSILQRTGGSASEIRSLQNQINSKLQENYFNKQQEEIDSIQSAVDKQTEALEKQIKIQEESLEYQKANGLIWQKVDAMINGTENWRDLLGYIAVNTESYKDMSMEELQRTLLVGSDSVGITIQEMLGYLNDDTYNETMAAAQKAVSDNTDRIKTSVKNIEDELIKSEDKAGSAPNKLGIAHSTGLVDKKTYDEMSAEAKANYNLAFSNLSSTQQSAYQEAVKRGDLSEDTQKNVDLVAQQNKFKSAYSQVEEIYGDAPLSEITNSLKYLLNGGKAKQMQDSLKTLDKLTIDDMGGNQALYDQVKEIVDVYKTNFTSKKNTTGVNSIGDNAQRELYNDTNYQSVINPDNFWIASTGNAPFATDAFDNKKKVNWKNAKGTTMKGTAIPKGTALKIIGFNGTGRDDRAYVSWTDPYGVKRNGYIKLSADQKGELKKLSDFEELKKNNQLPRYLEGGLANFTGPAWLDGTKTKPEAVLSSKDYALLKGKLFSDSKYSLRGILDMAGDFAKSMSNSTSSIENNGGITFENVNLTIESGTISNDYDAKRAGENIMEEMLKIARKSGNISIVRR